MRRSTSTTGPSAARVLAIGVAAAGAARLGRWVRRAARGLPSALGASRTALRRAAEGSPHFVDGSFVNVEPSHVVGSADAVDMARAAVAARGLGRPTGEVPLLDPVFPPAADLAVTWLGHASVLLEVDGHRVLADPVWGERVSPSPTVGPRRIHPAPCAIEDLPPVEAVLISHDHYDHLDVPTVEALLRSQSAPFVVPLGVGAHLRSWGVPDGRIVELDWGGEHTIGDLRLACVRARHFSGRGLRRNDTLWASWALLGPRHRAYFGGDTGYTTAFAEAAATYGAFDLTVLPIGAYGAQWPDIHMNPEEAVQAHLDLDGGLLVPIHWATFNLAFHGWAEPADRLYGAALRSGITVRIPQPGQRVDAADPPDLHDWWTEVAGVPDRRTSHSG